MSTSLIAFTLFCLGAAIQDKAPAPPAPQSTPPAPPTLIVRGGQLFDAEAGAARPLGQLWIAGDRILGEKPADAALPAGVTVVDNSGCTLLPSLFDLHVHVAVPGGGMSGGAMLDPAENLATALAFGVGHVVDLHNSPEAVIPLRERSRGAPDLARLLGAFAAFTAPGGHASQFGIEANTVTTVEDVGARFDKLLPQKPDVVKAILEHGGWGPVGKLPTLDLPLVTEIAKRTHAAGLKLFVHVWTLDEAKTAVRAGADVLAHGVYIGAVDDELLALMKEHSTAYVPTLAVVVGSRRVSAGKTPYTSERLAGLLDGEIAKQLADAASPSWASQWPEANDALFLANLKKVYAAGIAVGTGTDGGNPLTPHGPALLEEVALYVEAGLTPAQALRCATLQSAQILGREKEFGSLAAGKVADFVVVRGDPVAHVEELWKIERVFKAGHEVDRAALRARQSQRALAADAPKRVHKVGEDVPATLDDFDDGDLTSGWGGDWNVLADAVAPGGKSAATIEVVESEGSGHLLMKGTLADGFQYGPFVGATVMWDPQARTLVDASAMKEIVLRVRGSPRTFSLSLDRAGVKDYNIFVASIAVLDEWQELRVPLASFKQIGYGKAIPVAWNDLKGFTLQARGASGSKEMGEFEVEVDWIRME